MGLFAFRRYLPDAQPKKPDDDQVERDVPQDEVREVEIQDQDKSQPEPTKEQADLFDTDSVDTEKVPSMEMTRDELVSLAKEQGVVIKSDMTKAEIIEAFNK